MNSALRAALGTVALATAGVLAVGVCPASATPSESTTSTTSPADSADAQFSESPAPDTTAVVPTAEPTVTPTAETTEPITETTPEAATSRPPSSVSPATSTTSSNPSTEDVKHGRAAVAPSAASDLSVSAGSYGTIVPYATSATGILPTVTVSTWQGQGWSASASSTDFTCPNGAVIPKSQVTYSATAPAGVAGTATGPQTLASPKTVFTSGGSGLNGVLNTGTWTPALTVAYPNGASMCTYTGTITVSAY